jgi:hypothetical protein
VVALDLFIRTRSWSRSRRAKPVFKGILQNLRQPSVPLGHPPRVMLSERLLCAQKLCDIADRDSVLQIQARKNVENGGGLAVPGKGAISKALLSFSRQYSVIVMMLSESPWMKGWVPRLFARTRSRVQSQSGRYPKTSPVLLRANQYFVSPESADVEDAHIANPKARVDGEPAKSFTS